MDISTITSTITAALICLKKPIQDTADKAISDGYEMLKRLVSAKLEGNSDASSALSKLEDKPESKARHDLLVEELSDQKLELDPAIIKAVNALVKALPKKSKSSQFKVSIRQTGRGNKAQIAGRDLVITEKHVEVVKFTPDDSHISSEQCRKLKDLIDKLAPKLAGEDGKPAYQTAFSRLYKKFKVTSYREIKKEDFPAAVSYLQQQRAINRRTLKRSNPQAYRNDLYRPIWAKVKELGWPDGHIYNFAVEKLALKKPISSLKQLGPNQLTDLYKHLLRQT